MTMLRRDGFHPSGFSRWTREHHDLDARKDKLSVTDNDFWFHKYVSRNERFTSPLSTWIEWIMLVEEKSYSANVPYSQRDTLSIVDALMRAASVKNGRRRGVPVKDWRQPSTKRIVRPLGVHVLRMSADRPDNSERMFWDSHPVTESELLELLRFERDPDYPSRMLDTRRHHARPFRERHPCFEFCSEQPG